MRAAIHLLEQELFPSMESNIYITEQATPLFSIRKKRFPRIMGSEYFGESIPNGSTHSTGIRNKDVTKLSFPNSSFDHVLSFDVLEHVPDYQKALSEFYRVLKPGGRLLLNVPFRPDLAYTLIRSKLNDDGTIFHVLPPEYHGDPIRSEGCLSFYHFGWDFLEQIRMAGFVNVMAIIYRSEKLGYLGEDQVILLATKNEFYRNQGNILKMHWDQ
jgi:SAM-dependent methyltransferase